MGDGSTDDPHVGRTTDETSTQDTDEQENPQSRATDFAQEEDTDEEEAESEIVSDGSSSAGGGGTASGAALVEPSSEVEIDSEKPDEQEQGSESSAKDEAGQSESDDHDEVEEQAVRIVVYTDPWDNIGWGLYPVLYRLKEEYGTQIQIDERLVPVREFDSPIAMAEKWENDSRRHQMPVNTSIWNSDPPASTAKSNRAYAAARQQSIGLARKYLRRLRIASIVEGVNIEDRETLISLAEEVGVDSHQLEEDWDKVSVRQSTQEIQTPETTMEIDGETPTWSGYLHIDDLYMPIEQIEIEKQESRPIQDFVEKYGPVAVKEVQQIYDLSREDALDKLEGADGLTSGAYGEPELWCRQ